MAKKSVRYRRRASQDVGSAVPPPSSAAPAGATDSDLQRELAELREKNRQLEATAARLTGELSRLTEDFEKRLGTRGSSVSSQVGRAMLALLQSPAALFRLPNHLRRRPSLTGKKAKAFTREELAAAYESGGMDALRALFDEQGASAAALERSLLALAKQYQKDNQPAKAATLGRAAYDINPQPTLAKWLAFRLFDAGQIKEPLALLEGPADGCAFSASETRRLQEIKTLAGFAVGLPEVPPKASPTYEPADGSLLYVAASCLPYHTSGYTTRTHELNLALQKAGKVTVVTRPGYPWDRPDRQGLPEGASTSVEGLEYLHIRTPSLTVPLNVYFLEAATGIAKTAAKKKVAAIHAASNHVNALPALLAARQLGVPFAYEMRGLWDMTRAAKVEGYEESDRYRLGMRFEALVAQEADRVFVISEALSRYIQKEWGVDPAKIELLPNCVNPETIERAKKMAGPKPDVFTVGYAGSLLEYEGLDLLIDALAELKKRGIIAHARIIGEGPERKTLEQRATQAGLDGNIHFLGRLTPDEARARLAETHAAVLPRRATPTCRLIPPLKLAEAEALGLPVIVPEIEALVEQTPSNGSLRHRFSPREAGALAALLEQLAALDKKGITPRPNPASTWEHYASRIQTKPSGSHPIAGSSLDDGSSGGAPENRSSRTSVGSNQLNEFDEIESLENSNPDLDVIEAFFDAFTVNIDKVTPLLNPLSPLQEQRDLTKSFLTELANIYEALAKETRSPKLARAVLRLYLRLGDLRSAVRVHSEHQLNSREVCRLVSLERHLDKSDFQPNATSPPSLGEGPIVYLLHNCLPYHSGGYAARAHGLIKGWINSGRDVVPIARLGYPYDRKATTGPIPLAQEIDGVTYNFLPDTQASVDDADQPAYWEQYANVVLSFLHSRRIQPGLVVAASFFGNALAGRKVADRLGSPLAYDMRGMAWLTNRSNNTALRGSALESVLLGMELHAAIISDHVFCITRQLREWLIGQGLDGRGLFLLPNGIHASLTDPATHDSLKVRQKFNIPSSTFVVGYVGTVVYYEGLDLLVDAIASLHREGVADLRVLIVGDGKHLETLRRKVAASPETAACVHFAGRVPPSELSDYFAAIDCVVIPRLRSELSDMISPMKPFDALLRKKPLILSSCGALVEIAQAAGCVTIFEAGNPTQLAHCIRMAQDTRGPSHAQLDEGCHWVETKRSWEFIASQGLAFLKKH